MLDPRSHDSSQIIHCASDDSSALLGYVSVAVETNFQPCEILGLSYASWSLSS